MSEGEPEAKRRRLDRGIIRTPADPREARSAGEGRRAWLWLPDAVEAPPRASAGESFAQAREFDLTVRRPPPSEEYVALEFDNERGEVRFAPLQSRVDLLRVAEAGHRAAHKPHRSMFVERREWTREEQLIREGEEAAITTDDPMRILQQIEAADDARRELEVARQLARDEEEAERRKAERERRGLAAEDAEAETTAARSTTQPLSLDALDEEEDEDEAERRERLRAEERRFQFQKDYDAGDDGARRGGGAEESKDGDAASDERWAWEERAPGGAEERKEGEPVVQSAPEASATSEGGASAVVATEAAASTAPAQAPPAQAPRRRSRFDVDALFDEEEDED